MPQLSFDPLKLLPMVILFITAMPSDATEHSSPLKQSSQIIVVVTESWNTPDGVAYWFDRQTDWNWRLRGGPTPVLIGRAGLAWGRGENNRADLTGPIKREGDDKAPAGVFRLGTAFGYGRNSVATRMPYLRLSTRIVAVDDPASRYYNQLVDKSKVSKPDWQSAENMVLADNRYQWGVVVRHNVPPIPRAGSCIFLHVWKDSVTATSGCTAMSKGSLVTLLRWLDPSERPALVQLPRAIYNQQRPRWGLPAL
ncbi:MAG TPA: L,D-transpeptidase family protein [Chthoniobacterales bacterium]|jgi:D-alanyl-D-alanine dipeptidase